MRFNNAVRFIFSVLTAHGRFNSLLSESNAVGIPSEHTSQKLYVISIRIKLPG
jgi:hypothetical protein